MDKEAVNRKGYKVWVPDLSNSDNPTWKEWLAFILKNKPWEFSKETILIGHSAGATEILRILEQLPDNVIIKKAILVAGYVTRGHMKEAYQYKDTMVNDKFNYKEIKKHANQFYFVCSDNDQYSCGVEEGRIMHKNFDGELIIKSGEGHFNLEINPPYKEFPLLLTLID